jgi:serine/threonine-protein kinase
MDPKVDPSSVETTLEPPLAVRTPAVSSVSRITSAPTADEGRFVAGTLLGGRYRIIGLLGRGGMGEVYRATDLMLGQSVALKFLPQEAASNPRLLERFQGEVRVARQVSHPNVCRVYDIGEMEGMPFISMEYVDGEDLADLLLRIGRLPADKALETARKLCAGLAAAHSRGVIHRDLKPQNIMIDKRGEVVIMDFGLAAIADQLSGPEARNGTPAYMAPEQLKGSEVTAKSDIYALGLVLYELFTGRKPFDAKNARQLLEMQESIHLPSMTSAAADIDPMVEKAIRRCLDPDPAKRPASALSVAMALPGGDPLAAALAAGETPSPELVASAGQQEGLGRGYSSACLVVILICLVIAIVLQSRTVAILRTPMDNPPDVLASKAREAAAAFGYPRRPADSALWLDEPSGFLERLDKLPKPHKWDEWLAAESSVVAIYRESPALMVAAPYGDISTNNPPPTRPGMVQVNLEAGGKLRWFSAMPLADAADLAQPVEPSAVFRLAGLDPAAFTETAPKFVPPGPADRLRAWKGPHPRIPNLDLTVEMAFWKGRVTAVHVLENWKDDRAAGVTASSQAIGIALMLVSGMGILAAILLARRNWKLGRVDHQGALRIGMARFFLGMLMWLGTVHAIPSSDTAGLFFNSMAGWLAWGAGFWFLYLALEPSVRARWPHSLVTWNRLLAGRWRDAQVGSHILIGAAVGSAVWTAAGLVEYFSGIEMGRSGALDPALGTRHWVAFHAGMMAAALAVGLVLFFALTGLRRLVKKDWIAAILASLFFTVVNVGSPDAPNWKARSAVFLGVFAVLLLVLLRYGLVTIMAAVFFLNTIDDLGLGGDWKAWYVPSGLATLALLLGIAIYAFWRSLGTRDLFDEAADTA